MSKIEELKQHNPYYGKSAIDIMHWLFDKPKYVELAVSLFKNAENARTYHNDVIEILADWEIPQEKIDALSIYELHFIYVFLDSVGRENITNLLKFAEYNERKLIVRNDISTYKNFDELENQINLAEIKIMGKELQSQTQILHDTDEWLVLKPLSFEASLKYGASTKWCTAMKNDPEYFIRYSKRGIVIYCINRSTGEKIAAFKNLNTDYEYETSFWDAKDIRVDSMDTNLPERILILIRSEFTNTKLTNWELFSDEYKAQYLSNTTMTTNTWHDEPNVAPNQGGLGLAIRNAITYDEDINVEELVERQMEERVVACNTAPPPFMGDMVEQAWRD
jgi:hypothetical protein